MSRLSLPIVGGMLALAVGVLLIGERSEAEPGDDVAVLDGAIGFFEDRVTARPGDFVAAAELSSRYLQRFAALGSIEDVTAADSVLRRSLDVNPAYGPSHGLVTRVHIARHEFPEALAAARRAWSLNPRRATNGLLFDAFYEMAQYDSAFVALSRLDRRSFGYLTRASRFEEHFGRIDAARRLMSRACRPDGLGVDRLRAWCAVRLGELDEARGARAAAARRYRAADALLPDYTAASMRLGGLALARGDLAEARARFRVAATRSVGVEALLRLAEISDLEADAAAADRYRREFLARVRRAEYGRAFWLPAAGALARLGAGDSALQLARADVDQRPGPESYQGLARVAQIVGDLETAALAADSARVFGVRGQG